MKKHLTLILFLCFNLAWAQRDSVSLKVWTLPECIRYALDNNLTVKRGVYTMENSKINYDQSKWILLPSLNASAGHGYNWGRSINPVTNLFTTQEIQSNTLSVGSSVTLFNGLRNQHTIKQNRNEYEASQQELEKTKNDVILNIVSLYTNVIFSKELFENAQYQLVSSQEQSARTQKQVDAGSLPKSNALNMEAQVASNELNLVNRENQLNLSLLELKQALQLPASTPLDVESPELDISDLVIDGDREETYQIALQTMPEIKGSRFREQSAYYSYKASKGSLYPRLILQGGLTSNYSSASDRPRFMPDGGITYLDKPIGYVFGTNTPVMSTFEIPTGTTLPTYGRPDQLKDNVYRSLSLSLSIPIFNGMQSRLSMQRSMIIHEQAKINETEMENRLRQVIETSFNDALASSKTYMSTLKQLSAREEAYRMVKQRYELGAATYVEYQVSENEYFQAKSDLVRAKYDFLFKKKILEFYQGKPLNN